MKIKILLKQFVEIQNEIDNSERKSKWIPFNLSQKLVKIKEELALYGL